jgi:hypothetical protein
VIVHVCNAAVHPAPPDVLGQLSLDHHLHAQREGVEHRPDATEDDGDGEQLLGCAERLDLPEPDGAHGRDRLVQRVGGCHAEHDVADRAGDDDRHDQQDRPPESGRAREARLTAGHHRAT